jgi:hypothetical protein
LLTPSRTEKGLGGTRESGRREEDVARLQQGGRDAVPSAVTRFRARRCPAGRGGAGAGPRCRPAGGGGGGRLATASQQGTVSQATPDHRFCLHRLDNLLNMAYGVKR